VEEVWRRTGEGRGSEKVAEGNWALRFDPALRLAKVYQLPAEQQTRDARSVAMGVQRWRTAKLVDLTWRRWRAAGSGERINCFAGKGQGSPGPCTAASKVR
jgi:hypothetical protein